MSSSSDKVAIVTGSSRGIGADIATRLARDGFKVVVNYASGSAPAEEVVAKIREAGGQALLFKADIADPAATIAMFDAAQKTFGAIDVVVNSAGVMRQAKIVDFDDATFDRSVAINFKGAFNVSREAARRVRDGGRIINLTTSVTGVRLPTYAVYIATKCAVEGLTQVLAQELRGRKITVNAVAPGPVATELFLAGKSPELIDRMAHMNPLERLGQTDDIANVVAFLAGEQGGWINGQIVRANGGMC
ncbi:SDR family oxidoreductase [Trinickia diaoshuihuensis]|uniref:SDR family oxidoreductase n=1 Tax=Trinickia diaoshuihuensis TaxID=2292265 RepID=UPI000E2593F3|nr:SDR family oxidoreductase [Trinickia diaoshuihuensis]